MSTEEHRTDLTPEETEIYDRQIRLWGASAQRRLSQATVLVCNLAEQAVTPLLSELLKNLVLAGVGRVRLSVCEDRPNNAWRHGTPGQLGCFLGTDAESLVQQLREMNPLVQVERAPAVEAVLRDGRGCYDLVCICVDAVEAEPLTAGESWRCVALADRCTAAGVPCLVGGVHGLCGALFVDIPRGTESSAASNVRAAEVSRKRPRRGARKTGNERSPSTHTVESHYAQCLASVRERLDSVESVAAIETGHQRDFALWMALRTGVATPWCSNGAAATSEPPAYAVHAAALVRAAQCLRGTTSSVAAVLGGIWSAEVVKIVSGATDTPVIDQFLFYDACDGSGAVTRAEASDSSQVA
ncbi:hypothetical protein CDCA_CDCA20G4814 [Cyanidium caldarium]|uniref:THIF-type NAD/FAD binding fold domain-containing protein n=1 Tax=Cyanidium caldarium TaxID=2771 RepID=A0AAV9J387_CYACA|nr:hypothetical protein CDCA_CDCA20G4814 [Cyanidium caldarium]